MTPDEVEGLNLAFDEALLIGVTLHQDWRRLAITLSALALPSDTEPMPADPRLAITLEGVGRVAVSWRGGRWDDVTAPILPLKVDDLLATFDSFGHQPIYGRDFIDSDDRFAEAERRLSLDVQLGPERTHTLRLFQEGNHDYIELWAWFESLGIRRADERGILSSVSLATVIEDGRRWWDALHAGDPRTAGLGIYPLQPGVFNQIEWPGDRK